MTAFLVVVAVGLGSYLFRVSMLVLAARVGGLPPAVERAARFAVPVSFAALAAGAVTDRVVAAGADTGEALAPVLAVVAAAVAVRRTGVPHAALLAGMPTLWLSLAVLP